MKLIPRVRQAFCKHEFPTYYTPVFKEDWGTVTFVRCCTKCEKVERVTMPLDNVEPAWWKLQSIRKQYYIH